MSNLIHKWIPTNAFLHKQGRLPSPRCPRCTKVEDADHIPSYAHETAIESRSTHTYAALSEIKKMTLCPVFMHTFEHLLTTYLKIPSEEHYGIDSKMTLDESINIAVHHQNLLGWKSGFISKKKD
jgi:hypothetical protein